MSIKEHINKKEVRFVLMTLAITVGVGFISDRFALGWPSAFALSFGMFGLLSWFAIKQKDPFLKRLLVFGIAAGLIELFADCWLVQKTGTLIYANDEPMIACSPLYMPFAWAVILIQVGYLGWLISNKLPMWLSIICTAIIGFLVIPAFEHFAKDAGWWYYTNCRMIFNTPYYIILGEGLICAFMPLLFKFIAHKNYGLALIMGIFEGFWIWIAYYISISILR